MTRPAFLPLLLVFAACGGAATSDAGGIDAGTSDAHASSDATVTDIGVGDGSCATDADGDGHRTIGCGGDDCDDTDPHRYPGNPEVCDAAGHDDDCNPATLGPDGDGDGFVSTACCNSQPSGTPLCGTDCDDMRATVSPSAVESCNGVDDNCDGMIDEGILRTEYYPDCDGDGFGDAAATPLSACATPMGAPPSCTTTGATWATTGTDCRDDAAGVHPGAAPPCSCVGMHTYDMDGDGYVSSGCGGDDCNDAVATAHPGGTETCNGVDDDCDGSPDFPLATPCVACGALGCMPTGGHMCCVGSSSDGPDDVCVMTSPICPFTNFAGDLMTCDGDEDCASGTRCCVVNFGGVDPNANCATTCGSVGSAYACHADTDCSPGHACTGTDSHSALRFCR